MDELQQLDHGQMPDFGQVDMQGGELGAEDGRQRDIIHTNDRNIFRNPLTSLQAYLHRPYRHQGRRASKAAAASRPPSVLGDAASIKPVSKGLKWLRYPSRRR